ncbi:MAG TPA: lipoprotein [Halomonas sp.]|nr:lipoprotein [Halomonas sp.]
MRAALPATPLAAALGLTFSLTLGLLLGGCGQKGPLYLPGDEAAAERYGIPAQSDAEPEEAEEPPSEQTDAPIDKPGQEAPAAPATDDKRDR